MSETLYPYVLEPKETEAIWGGDALAKQFGKEVDPKAKIGEVWECWDTNKITNGALAGSRLGDLREKLGPQVMGDLDPSRPFPVLTKIIDARDWLSVQVHPDDEYAQRVEHQPNGKTECWYVFSAQEGAQLVLGWTRDTSREEYEKRVADGTLGELLRKVPVHPGDVFYLPAGTLHAIGAGIELFETQQASDLTYRIFDWNRKGTDGKPRELHVQKAADVLDYHQGTKGAIQPLKYHFEGLDRTVLIASSRFVVEKITAGTEPSSIRTQNRPQIIMALEHPLNVSAGGTDVKLKAYETAVVPAGAERSTVSAPTGKVDFMFVTPPHGQEGCRVQLLAAGIDSETIDRFMEQFT